MPSNATFWRYSRRGEPPFVRTFDDPVPREVLVLDLHGERIGPPLRERVLQIPPVPSADMIVVRGASDYLRSQLYGSHGTRELRDLLHPRGKILDVRPGDVIGLHDVVADKPIDGEPRQTLLRLVREIEIEALLWRSEGVWSDSSFHFIAPSGFHTDRFIRLAEMLGNPTNVRRLADWLEPLLRRSTALVSDSPALLPVMQELELRTIPTGRRVTKQILPLYGLPDGEILERLHEVASWVRDNRGQILAIVSVSASGGFVREFRQRVKQLKSSPVFRIQVIVQASPRVDRAALCNIPARCFPTAATCEMCTSDHSPAFVIDPRTFATRIGSAELPMPKADAIADLSLMVGAADAAGALRVHVERADRHRHLAVYIDTRRLLRSKVFLARATIATSQCLQGFSPDVVLVPKHGATVALRQFIRRFVPKARILEIEPRLSPTKRLRHSIERARELLILDDCVISGRTLRAVLELVQHVKAGRGDTRYRMRALVLVARSASKETLQLLRARFFIRRESSLYCAWELQLPDNGANGRAVCPWCAEQKFLEKRRGTVHGLALQLIERRLKQLADPRGVHEYAFFGAAEVKGATLHRAGTHTSPHSYLGDARDVAAFVSCAALIQAMRSDWNSSPDRWFRVYSVPLGKLLQQFTDPVIGMSFLRSIASNELRAPEAIASLNAALIGLDHDQQHSVFGLELMLAKADGLLPKGVVLPTRLRRLRGVRAPTQRALLEVVSG